MERKLSAKKLTGGKLGLCPCRLSDDNSASSFAKKRQDPGNRGENEIEIRIWERGAGYTLASGSSSCAAASCAVHLGRVKSPVTVRMPGGTLRIEVGADRALLMEGPVEEVMTGRLSPDIKKRLE